MYSSKFLCYRSKGPLSFSCNDNSYLLTDRFDKSSSCCCNCSCCCARPACCGHSNYRVSISPSLLYGLRQSSLLQWSASRRLYIGGGDRYYCRLPVHGIDREVSDLYEEGSCAFRERNGERRNGGRRRRIKCTVSEENNQIRRLSCIEDAEAVLSLLSEEVDEECFDSRGKRGSGSFKRCEVERKKIHGSEHSRGRKKKGSVSKGNNSKCKLESIEIKLRDDVCTQDEGRGDYRREENRRAKKEASSCSSYYSFSSSGGFESDVEDTRDDRFVGETSNGHCKDSRRREESKTDNEILEEDRIYREEREENETLEKKKAMARSNLELDWRKKSEKKLNELSVDEAPYQKESSEGCSTTSRTHDYDDRKSSTSCTQFTGAEKKSTFSMNLDSRASISHRQNENENENVNISKLERKSKRNKEVCGACGSEVKVSSQSEKQISSREGKLMVSSGSILKNRNKHGKPAGHVAERDEFAGNTQGFSQKLEIQEMDTEETSSLHRKSRRNDWEVNVNLGSSSAQKREEQSHQDDQITTKGKSGKSQQVTEPSESNQTAEGMSVVQSNRINLQQKTNVVSYSYPSERVAHSSGESQDDVNKSKFCASETETARSSQQISEKRMASQDTNLTSVVILSGEAQDRQKEKSRGKVMQSESGSGSMPPRLTKQSSSHQKVVERPSSNQNINLVYQQNVQVINQEVNTVNSQSLLTPPPSQLVARGSSYADKTGGMPTEENFLESGSNTSSTHRETQTSALHAQLDSGGRRDGNHGESLYSRTHEDSLESALRMEESSGKFVREYIEKARHEISSEAEVDTSDAKSGYSSKNDIQASSTQYGSEDVQLKNRDSRHPSGSSGSKGPSDEIWHDIDPSVHEVLKLEEPDSSTTSGPVAVRRSGRSLWNIMADIVRLRWGSRAESSTLAARSGGKSTMNESVSSDTWFSGHEHDENNGENVKRERSTPQKVTYCDQLQPLHSLTRNRTHSPRGEKRIPSEAEIPSPVKSGSSSAKTISSGSAQQEEDFDWHEKVQDTNSPPLALELVESSLPQPPRVTTPPREASSDTGEALLAGGGLREELDQNAEKLIEVGGAEAMSSPLKQRKFQRAKQVTRDRFDEWEEAYRLESEQRKIDEMFMREALVEAKKAAEKWEVPVGAVLVQHGKIIARGFNLVEELRDSTAHAEMICIKEASNVLRSWRLAETTLYVTLEPCPMCAGAILQARVDTLVWGAPNKLLGADGSWVRLFPIGEGGTASKGTDKPAPPVHPFHPKMTIRRGVLESECADAMQQFFQLRRRKKDKKSEPITPPSCLPISSHPSRLLNKMHDMFHLMFCL
ncbi:hypothetical protein BT93_C2091 [Corymbia citriodora subsp. variegata]|nr:hypothetical protein BT93_C2091 [Corymbia citriodora subsp. variegata]